MLFSLLSVLNRAAVSVAAQESVEDDIMFSACVKKL